MAGMNDPGTQVENDHNELRKLVEDEIGQENRQGATSFAFTPLTDGLGLNSPRKREPSPGENMAPPQPVSRPSDLSGGARRITTFVASAPSPRVEKVTPPEEEIEREALPQTEIQKASRAEPETSLTSIMSNQGREIERDEVLVPPPLPRPSFMRRMLAAFVDELFILTLFSVSLVTTLKVQTGTFQPQSGGAILASAAFIRAAVLEFLALWLTYFSFCIGLLDMTFGMWVWNIRIGYGKPSSKFCTGKKLRRIGLSLLFYAPVVPLVVLVFRRKGRSLMDALSGTQVYLSRT